MRTKQLNLLPKISSAYGGELLRRRKGRAHGRPLSTKQSIHLVLRSTLAKGDMSFRRPNHAKKIAYLIERFSKKHGVIIYSVANVGNHLHFQLKLIKRESYTPFIRALTSAIAMAVTGRNRWTAKEKKKEKFWDLRPYTRVLVGRRSFFGLKEYIQINQLEGEGLYRHEARWIVGLSQGQAPPS